MIIEEISLINFRNYKNLNISFSPNINIIYGNNGEGKTNLLEAIYVLGLSKSYKTPFTSYLINNNCSFSHIKGIIKTDNIKSTLEITIEPNKKILKIDKNNIFKIADYINKLNIIIFSPEDLELIKGSPSERRKYFDVQISQINLKYFKLLNEYNKILKQRNEILKTKKIDKKYFNIITESLIKRGIEIYKYRNNYIENINRNINDIFYNITDLKGFKIKYNPLINININDELKLIEKYKEEIEKNYENELKIGSTLVGPHRDDFDFFIETKNLKNYGSQGQQRSGALALKLSEIPIFKKYNKTFPVLLLDDVFSELDDSKKNNILKYISKDIQIFITTTDLKSINQNIIKQANIIKIKNGNLVYEREV